jgi:hypothetical protein
MIKTLKRTLLTVLMLGVIAPLVSAAVPLQMPLQGVLRDNAGAPVVEGEFEMTFSIYADAESEESVWTETRMVTAQGGQFRLNLGTETPLSASIFAASGALWIGVTVEGEPELPRRPMGTTPYAFQATSAQGLACSGCIEPEAFSDAAKQMVRDEAVQAVTDAGYASQATQIAFDDTTTDIGAETVQSALETLQGLITNQQSSSNVNEGAGTVRAYTNQWGLPSYGTATDYVHVINPTPPKVQLYLYGGENTGFASSNNLIVTNTYAPNSYAGAVNGVAGEESLQVGDNVAAFNVGDHILIHQTVGNDPGHWELNAVKSVQGSAVGLAKPLTHTYESATGNDQRRAQVVIAASYNQLEVTNGGIIRPSEGLGGNNYDNLKGGIVYVRAQSITVKTGGKIQAEGTTYTNGYGGFWGADVQTNPSSERGQSECSVENNVYTRNPNCSGGGGGRYYSSTCSNGTNAAAGGGGNQTPGGDGQGGGTFGYGGAAKGSADGATLEFGGGGGDAYYDGGRGGGIVVLGAKTIIVESGGIISANGGHAGQSANCRGGAGGGAGGSVVLFGETIDNAGTIEATGGSGGDGYSNKEGGDGGEGWVLELDPIPGAVNQSYATGVEIYVDGQEVTSLIGDPNGKGAPHWNVTDENWGATGTQPWNSGPLDLTNVADWTLGEHTVEFKETGGAGGDLKAYLYLIQTFSESSPPANDTCTTPLAIDLSEGPVVLSGTTEDVMGKVQATDANSSSCGGEGGADVTYRIDLAERSLINVAATSPFPMRLYLRSESCSDGEVVYCATDDFSTTPLEPGTYFLVVDADEPGAKGNFTLGVSLTPALLPINDTCDTAVELIFSNAGIATHTSSTLYSLDQYSAFCGGDGGPDLVYAFTAGTGEAVDIAVTSGDFTPVLHLYKGACAEPESIITCTDTGSIQIPGGLGGDYWLVVDSPGEAEWGDYDLTVTLN